MALNSINTNIAAYSAQANIGKASNMASSSIARLSSGNRIVRAADDVAAMSAGTSLRTNVTTLRMALINTSQGSSLLQVADGALSQVTDILQRQKAIAVQAGSGSLTSAERGFLDQEFQNLTQEIDRLAGQTNFNGVTLLDGALSDKVGTDSVATNGDAATASVTFQQNITAATSIVLNGVTVTEGAAADFLRGNDITETLDNLVIALSDGSTFNAAEQEALSQATYERQGNSLVITQRTGGSLGETYTIDGDIANSTMLNDGANNLIVGSVSGQYAGTTTTSFSGMNGGAFIQVTDADSTSVAESGSTTYFDSDATVDINDAAGNTVNIAIAPGDTLENIVTKINAQTNNTGVTARIEGSAGAYDLIFESKTSREFDPTDSSSAGNGMEVTFDYAGATVDSTGAGEEVHNNTYSLVGGTDSGLGYARTVASGSVGDNILLDNQQGRTSVTIDFPEIADANLNNEVDAATDAGLAADANGNVAQVTVAGVTFGFVGQESDVITDVEIGATLEESLDNLVTAINSYTGVSGSNFGLEQVQAYRDGNSIVVESKEYTDEIFENDGTTTLTATLSADLTTLGASVSNAGNFDNGLSQGVITQGINNDAFIGQISGFEATFTGANDTVNVSVTIGGIEYNAYEVDTTPTANTTIRLSSEEGGYFDIQVGANNGETVTSQNNADTYSDRLNAAFESLTFYQRREVSSYAAESTITTNGQITGSLIGTSVDFQLSNFDDVVVEAISVEAPQGVAENGSLSITVNGRVYTTSNTVGSALAANSVIRLTSTDNNDEAIEFRTGNTAIEFDTDAKAAAFEDALKADFGVGEGAEALKFQVGVTVTDTLAISVGGVTADKLGLSGLDVTTAENAAIASDAIDAAIDIVTSIRADVGALQSRFDFAAANVESSIQNQDAARGVLLDTDVASESTKYSTAQVQLQAGIAVLAQANLLPQNLLKLIG